MFEHVVWDLMAANQMRSAAADAPVPGPGAGRVDQRRVVGQAEKIIAAETDQLPSVDHGKRPARRFQRASTAFQAGAVECS